MYGVNFETAADRRRKTKGAFGNPRPQHFDAARSGWVPGKNKKGKPCKVWVEDRRPREARK
jgi:hypothetical protein